MADDDGWVNPRLAQRAISPYRRPIRSLPRRPPTAILSASGGLAGGESNEHPSAPLELPKWRYGNLRRPRPSSSVSLLPQPPPPSSAVPLHRHPPSSTDPYRIRGGLQKLELEHELEGDDGTPDGLGVAGGMEEERCETGVEVMSPMDFSSVYFPWKPSTESWAECVALADKQIKEEGFFSLDEVISF